MSVTASGSDTNAMAITPARRTYLLTLLTVIYTLAYLDRQIINILAEPIKHDLGLADWQMGAMTGFAFALFYTVLGIPMARYSERGNRIFIIAGALAAWSGFTAFSAFAQNFIHMLLARIGVGIGEAGCVPPAHSLISDITPREKRASALAIFSMGLPIGTLFGMALGGVVAEYYGWRTAFLLVGLPGVVLATLMLFTARDPRVAELKTMSQPPEEVLPLTATFKMLWRTASFRWMAIGAALIAFAGYGHQSFYGSFYLRNHGDGLDRMAAFFGIDGRLAILGLSLGLILGATATIGTGLGGKMGDRLAANGPEGYMIIPIWATAAAAPFLIAAFLVGGTIWSLLLLAVPSLLKGMWYGPVFASVQSIVPPRSRATAVAMFLFVVNAVGIGFGPVLAGAISDLSSHALGADEGLRLSMIILSFSVLAAAGCFAKAKRTIATDFRS